LLFLKIYNELIHLGYADDNFSDKDVLVWKFKQLDKNGDTFLKKNETKIFQRLVKQQIKPRRCARTFARYCAKGDSKITETEWLSCLQVTSIDKCELNHRIKYACLSM